VTRRGPTELAGCSRAAPNQPASANDPVVMSRTIPLRSHPPSHHRMYQRDLASFLQAMGLRPPAISWECSSSRPRTSRLSAIRVALAPPCPFIIVILDLNFMARLARRGRSVRH